MYIKIKFMNNKFCPNSKDSKHEWVYPRFEDSIDKDRPKAKVYCKNCFLSYFIPPPVQERNDDIFFDSSIFSMVVHRTLTD